MKSIMSARTIDISSMTISSRSLMSLTFSDEYFRRFFNTFSDRSGSSGISGLKGILKNEWSVCPPTLTAAMPVGASTICFLAVLAVMCFRKVDLPVPALPVMKTERLVVSISRITF